MSDWVLVIDSGTGGKMVFSKIKRVFPSEDYILFIDKNYCPYGNKSREDLKKHIQQVFDYFTAHFSIKVVIIACNTLSSMFKDFLKDRYKEVRFFFYEPFLNKLILSRPTLVLATTNTINNSEVIKKYHNNANCYTAGFSYLAKMIDDKSPDIQNYLFTQLSKYKGKEIKNIVLGCTHYEAIKPNLEKIFGKVSFYDKTPIIIEQLSKILSRRMINGTTLYFEDIVKSELYQGNL